MAKFTQYNNIAAYLTSNKVKCAFLLSIMGRSLTSYVPEYLYLLQTKKYEELWATCHIAFHEHWPILELTEKEIKEGLTMPKKTVDEKQVCV